MKLAFIIMCYRQKFVIKIKFINSSLFRFFIIFVVMCYALTTTGEEKNDVQPGFIFESKCSQQNKAWTENITILWSHDRFSQITLHYRLLRKIDLYKLLATWFEWRSNVPKWESAPSSAGKVASALFLEFDGAISQQFSKTQKFKGKWKVKKMHV